MGVEGDDGRESNNKPGDDERPKVNADSEGALDSGGEDTRRR